MLPSRLRSLYEIQHTTHITLYSMEGLRGLAVFLVFMVHYVTLAGPWIYNTGWFFQGMALIRSLGNTGVDLFFVLSGYLIYGSLIRKERPFIPYLRRRIERIYPTFSVVLLIYLLLSYLLPEKSRIPNSLWDGVRYIAENFLLLPGIFNIEPIITVAWSLSYEFFFYLTVPLLIYLLRLRYWPSQYRILFFTFFGLTILTIPTVVVGHIRLAMFIAGILVFEVAAHLRPPKFIDGLALLALASALVGTVAQKVLGFDGQWKFAILGFSFFVLCLVCFTVDGYSSRAFRWRPLRWLGNISYSYYLLHGLVLNAFFLAAYKVIPPDGNNVLAFCLGLAASFPATFVASTVLFALIEKPLSLTNRRRTPVVSTKTDCAP